VPTVFFITHPDVAIDPAVAIPDWPLDGCGRERMRATAGSPWAAEVLSPCRSRRPDRGLNRRPDPRQRDGSLAFSQIGSATVVRHQFFGMIYVG
jgi:hypothetical protein